MAVDVSQRRAYRGLGPRRCEALVTSSK
jgi:hypothetical protein